MVGDWVHEQGNNKTEDNWNLKKYRLYDNNCFFYIISFGYTSFEIHGSNFKHIILITTCILNSFMDDITESSHKT